MDGHRNATHTDLDLLNRLKPLSFLSPVAMHELASRLNPANFRRRQVIFTEEALASGVHILLRGVAKITCLNAAGQRVPIAILAPGPIPQFVSLPITQRDFRCEAHSDCRVGSLSWDQFDVITRAAPQSALRKFHEDNLKQWYRFFAEAATFTSVSCLRFFNCVRASESQSRVVPFCESPSATRTWPVW